MKLWYNNRKGVLYLRMPVLAFTAKIRTLNPAGSEDIAKMKNALPSIPDAVTCPLPEIKPGTGGTADSAFATSSSLPNIKDYRK